MYQLTNTIPQQETVSLADKEHIETGGGRERDRIEWSNQ